MKQMMFRSMSIAAVALAVILWAGSAALALHRQSSDRRRLVTDAALLAKSRGEAFSQTLDQLVERVGLFSSSDRVVSYAKARVRAGAQRTRGGVGTIYPSLAAQGDVLDAMGRARLLDTSTRVDVSSGTLGPVARSVTLDQTWSARRPIVIVSAPIRGASRTKRLFLVVAVPLERVLRAGLVARQKVGTELLSDGSVLAAVSREDDPGAEGENRKVAEFFVGQSGIFNTTETGRHVWGFYRLPQRVGSGRGLQSWFLAVRHQTPVPGLFEQLVRFESLLLIFAGLGLGVAGLLGMRARRRILERSAGTDQLTGIPNRRALILHLEEMVRKREPVRLALFDLNGFKDYNDTFGHVAGDALLRRVALTVRKSVAPARAYRLGGDEFCVLSPPDMADEVERRAAAALVERGPGVTVDASWGSVAFPAEASSTGEILATADERMYRHKRCARAGPQAQTRAALQQLMAERDPDLALHHQRVADLAERTAREMGLPADTLPHLRVAAELHGIGLLAMPDATHGVSGPLVKEDFLRRQAMLGERILGAAESLQAAAAVVQASPERWDVAGYTPVQGEQIRLAARIVRACDAYDAMTCDHTDGRAMSSETARAELRKEAGGRYDPSVIAALERVLDSDTSQAELSPPFPAIRRDGGAAPDDRAVAGR